jgi:hypothetical protein
MINGVDYMIKFFCRVGKKGLFAHRVSQMLKVGVQSNHLHTLSLLNCLFILQTGCTEPLLNPHHSPVKQLGNGEYSYDFKYSKDCVVDDIKACTLKSMQEKNLVPADCREIRLLKGGYAQGGWAWATFTCY